MLSPSRITELTEAAVRMRGAARSRTSRSTTYAVPNPEDGAYLVEWLSPYGEAAVLEQLPSMGGHVVHFTLADTDLASATEALEAARDAAECKLIAAMRQRNALIPACRSLHDYLILSSSGIASAEEVAAAFRIARLQFREAAEAVPELAAPGTLPQPIA